MMYQAEVEGKGGIIARVVAKSVSKLNVTITTLELEYPRLIHSELMTHRLFSRNAASSRAIPITKVIGQVRDNPAMPVHWGKNQPGMQAQHELEGEDLENIEQLWRDAGSHAAQIAGKMAEINAHKQVVNRILEPFQFMKTVVTSTEWNNWDSLRFHEDADPTIYELARVLKEARDSVEAVELKTGDWHVPYYNGGFWLSGDAVPLETALAVSASCCAQVSFRLLDLSLEKAERVFDRLIHSKPVHASPTEHQASPMQICQVSDINYNVNSICPDTWEPGVTHMDRDGNFWSGNLMGWIQHRQFIHGNVVKG